MDFSDDRRGSDGERQRIAVEQARLCTCIGELGEVKAHRVNEEMVRRCDEALYSQKHGQARGLVDVNTVDRLRVDFSDGNADGYRANLAVKFFALFAGELLGILEAEAREGGSAGGKDDSGRDDGSEESTTADFIDAGDGLEAVVPEGLLGRISAAKLLEHLLLCGCFGHAGDMGNLKEGGHEFAPYKPTPV